MNDFSLLSRLVFIGLILTLITASSGSGDESRLPWNMNALRKAPGYSALSRNGNLAAIYYDGEPYRDKPTKVFAYVAYPQSVKGKAPAVVLVHGGAGRAFPEWAQMWADRGYVALAMDLDGRGPDGVPNEHAGPPLGSVLDDCKLTDAWTYHAVSDVIKGVSLLSSLPEVDPKRIGITGISWGGYVTCIVAGLDYRLKAAVPVYGCGYLAENSAWTDAFKQMSEGRRKKWIKNFDPSSHLSRAKMPVLFVNGTNDTHYYLDIYQKSYRLAKNRTLCIIPGRLHGYDQGWSPVEIEIFINSYLKGGSPLPSIKTPAVKDKTIEAGFNSIAPVIDAKLHYTTDNGPWQKRNWQTVDAQIKGNKIVAELPETIPLAYFLTVTGNRGAIVSTEHEVIVGGVCCAIMIYGERDA